MNPKRKGATFRSLLVILCTVVVLPGDTLADVASRANAAITAVNDNAATVPTIAGTLLTLWATPTMTAGHLLLAGVFSAYVLVGVRLEERDLLRAHGESFRSYRDDVPGFLPTLAPLRRRRRPRHADRPAAGTSGRSA